VRPVVPAGRTLPAVNWDVFVQALVNGITLGSVYALIALGYSMVYGILKLLNFAHGEVFMIGAFVGYGVLTVSGGAVDPMFPIYLLLPFMFLAAMLGAGVLGVVIERFAYKPLRNAPRIAPLISALGVSFFLQNSALLLFGADYRSYSSTSLDGGSLFFEGVDWGPLHISLIRIIVIASTFALMIGLALFISKSRIGKAMRATAYDREAAAMMGIDVDRVIIIAFFIGSALAGAAGVMVGLVFQRIYHFMGFTAGLKGFTAAVIGGIGSIPGAMLGGLLIGLAESFSQIYVSTRFYDLVVFAILIAVLIFRPSGLLGKADIKKV
jgi:branched-chain amino acid transport system permease protein